jgi:hypothetical protein
MIHRINSRLAARTGTRQIELLIKAERAANDAGSMVRTVWKALLKSIERGNTFFYIPWHGLEASVELSLKRLAYDSHEYTRAVLRKSVPLEYLRAAAWQRLSVPVREDIAVDRPGIIELALRALGLTQTDFASPLREPAKAELPDDAQRDLFIRLLFPPPSLEMVNRIIYSTDWVQRLAAATKLATGPELAPIIARGYAAGKSQREIAQDLRPIVGEVQSTARRIARTEGMRVAHGVQMEMHKPLDDLTIGWQVHATLDHWTRSWHAARSGTIYYREPEAGQKGMAQCPHPPDEAEDPAERPPNTRRVADNCRCWLAPVLAPPAHIINDPRKMAIFHNAASRVIPDPHEYGTWFQRADERRRRLAVGSRRYSEVQKALGHEPSWEHFLNPETGALLPRKILQAESMADRALRVHRVRGLLAQRKADLAAVATYGFVPPVKIAVEA